ncbi:hypothetical protein SAMN05216266_115100 [Amycolatopsis marina]|uniref:Uncharacterized protein n=1 Tax=Amycolatopsis marina TaxID=490629 RepID=A0A1I1BME8_9PSEU|nr:hypothetical protein [Amycolatopsis marina]SFB51471.1 hypothetical protein SAMN05216266_115100 [Amycolatopsis marina]
MHAPEVTSELEPVARVDAGQSSNRRTRRGRWWRGLTGSLVAGLVVLAVIVLGAQIAGLVSASEGPGPFMVVGHVVGAALAVVAQRIADRAHGGPAALAAAAVLLLAFTTLWLFWWA